MTKVLIIDDEDDLVEMLKLRITSGGFDVETAYDGESALKKIVTFKPDVVILDLIMPGMSGWEVLKRLKAQPDTEQIPVILATAVSSKDLEAKAQQHGATKVLIKPFDEQKMMAFLQTIK